MKTLNKNQKWSDGLSAYLQKNEYSDPRPKIGDDDGISNRSMNMVIILFTLLTIGISFVASAQSPDSLQCRIMLRQAMLDIDRMDYDKAIVKLQQVRSNTPENANVNHLLGLCYLNSGNSYEKAVFYLSRSLENTASDYQEWDLDESRAPLEVKYLLARAYESTEHFDMAANLYAEFLSAQSAAKLHPSSKTYALINRSAESCRLAAAGQGTGMENENIVFNQ